ncbi:MAG: 3-isopropylmalate dehydrogenase [Anaerolineae bacterium]|nr:3-isopropylmalate dehydrogenase [Anaerolineae bacterium]
MQAKIITLPGDGIGPEVVTEAVRVLEQVAARFGHTWTFEEAQIGGCAIDVTGTSLPDETIRVCETADAVLLGAVGGLKWSDPTAAVRPEQGLLQLRQHFDLFANLRPVKAYPALAQHAPLRADLLQNVDILFVRELTSGIYFGERAEQGDGDRAWDTMAYTTGQVERIARVAFEAAQRRRGKLASVDKANVLAVMRLWRRTVNEVSADYPDVALEHVLVDACAMHLLRNPGRFDVVLAGNLFGDILSDEASVLAGSLGMLPSASVSTSRFGLYEPIHGSAPDIAGQNIANPTGTILSAAMLLRHSLGLDAEADAVEDAVDNVLAAGARTADLVGPDDTPIGTTAFTDRVLEHLSVPIGQVD